MLVYRIQKSIYAQSREDILSGEGARLYGGRWNLKGIPMIYTSSTPELAHSEYMIHFNNISPPSSNIICLDIPNYSILEARNLPDGWRKHENIAETQNFTREWLEKNDFLAMKIPSAIVPMSFNFLINPKNSEMNQIKIINSEVFIFDERFFKNHEDYIMKNVLDEMINSNPKPPKY